MSARIGIFIALSSAVFYFVFSWIAAVRNGSEEQRASSRGDAALRPSLLQLAVGFATNFFDTLGIGSFATTAIFKLGCMVPEEQIPGTLNVGHTLPVVLQAFLYITIIEVDLKTLVLLVGSAVAGAWWGAGFVTRLPRRTIQLGIGTVWLRRSFFLAWESFICSRLQERSLPLVDSPSLSA